MKTEESFKGIWPVVVTPFDRDGKPDVAAYAEIISWYLDAGVHGVFANCLASEMFKLTREESIALIEKTVELCGGKVPVAATASIGDEFSQHAEFARTIEAVGADAVMLTPPVFCRDNDRELEAYFLGMADQVSCMLGVYECPVPQPKKLLTPNTVSTIARTGRFGPFKETSCDMGLLKPKIIAAADTPLSILQADCPIMLDALAAGADGFMGLVATVVPEMCVRLWNEKQNGGDVTQLHELLCVVNALIGLANPMSTKYLLGLRGLPIQPTSRTTPPIPLSKNQTKIDYAWKHIQRIAQRAG